MATLSTSPAASRSEPFAAAYFWLVLFFIVYCARPEDWIPHLTAVPLAKVAAIPALVALLVAIGQLQRRPPREVVLLVLLFVQLCVSAVLSPVWRGGAVNNVLEFSKPVMMAVLAMLVVLTLPRLRRIILIQSASVVFVTVLSLVKNARDGTGRLTGAVNGMYGNPNDLAFCIVCALPFCLAFSLRAKGALQKAAWALSLLAMVYAMFLTGSRGGLLALVIATGVCLWEFAIKGHRPRLVALAVVAGVAIAIIAGRTLKERWSAMSSSQLDSRDDVAAYASAVQRRELLKKSLVVTAKHPLFGVGLGNFVVLSGNWHVAHNSYTEMGAEGGIPALVLYLMILGCGFKNVRQTEPLAHGDAETMLLAGALRATLVGCMVGSFFASYEYQIFTYLTIAYTTALVGLAEAKALSSPEAEPAKPVTRLGDIFRLGRASRIAET